MDGLGAECPLRVQIANLASGKLAYDLGNTSSKRHQMGAIDGVPLLLSAAEVTAQRFDESVSELHKLMDEQGGQTVFVNGLRLATVQIEISVVGIFSLFEARMQTKFPNGPFFKNLRAHLVDLGQAQLATDVWQYYLAVNVLKHGQGPSYNELCKTPGLPFSIKLPEEAFFEEGDIAEPEGLINVTGTGFFKSPAIPPGRCRPLSAHGGAPCRSRAPLAIRHPLRPLRCRPRSCTGCRPLPRVR